MYRATDPNIASTNFEASLDNYLKGMPWFKWIHIIIIM
jgi:hypothetical protein